MIGEHVRTREDFYERGQVVTLVTAVLFSLVVFGVGYATWLGDSGVFIHEGICDASGVVDLGNSEFAVADDELNSLLVYKIGQSGPPEASFEKSKFLNVVKSPKKKPKKNKKKNKKLKVKEVDIEGAARVGDYIVWISSHGRKSSGKEARERMRLFATTIVHSNSGTELQPKGVPYEDLLADILADVRYSEFGLKEASKKAPKAEGGLNIEAITDTHDGKLLIGFRSPLIDGKALIAPLMNHEEVISGENAKFGEPILLDLKGRGIRGLASHKKQYLIVANDPEGDGHHPALYHWADHKRDPVLLDSITFGDFNPEAVAILPDDEGGRVLVLSDDGSRELGQEKCKDLKDLQLRQFRSAILSHPDLRFD